MFLCKMFILFQVTDPEKINKKLVNSNNLAQFIVSRLYCTLGQIQ